MLKFQLIKMLKHFHCTRNFLGQIYINILNAGPIYHVKVNTLDLKIYVHIFIFMYILDAVSHFYHLKLHYFFPSYFIKWYLFMWNNLPDEPPMKWRFKGGGANITKKIRIHQRPRLVHYECWVLNQSHLRNWKIHFYF